MVALAIAWHVGLAILEHRWYRRRGGPPLSKLLLLAEAELLRTLRAEFRRHGPREGERRRELKLSQIEDRLKELENGEG